MNIKVYTIQVDVPRWLRNLMVYGGIPIVTLAGAALVLGATLTTFTSGGVIDAAAVNNNFSGLNADVASLSTSLTATNANVTAATVTANAATTNISNLTATVAANNTTPLTVLTVAAGTQTTLVHGTDGPYSAASLVLTAGTWLVQGQGSLLTTDVPDGVRLGLFQVGVTGPIPGSLSATAYTAVINEPMALATPPVKIVVASSATIQLFGARNGSSTLAIGVPLGIIGGAATDGSQRVTATKLSH